MALHKLKILPFQPKAMPEHQFVCNYVVVGDAGQLRHIGIYPRVQSYLLWVLLGKFSMHRSRSGLPVEHVCHHIAPEGK